jgi:hypothetical protein
VCDTVDFLKLDTKTIETSEGPRQYWFTVVGNPCATSRGSAFLEDVFISPFDGRSYTLRGVAAEVRCSDDGELLGATLSDSGLPIIGMLHDSMEASSALVTPLVDATPGRISVDAQYGNFNDYRDMQPVCQERAENGFASGMGEIFRQVAGVAPLYNISGPSWSHGARVGVPPQSSVAQQSSTSLHGAIDEGLDEPGAAGGDDELPVTAIACAAVATVLFGAMAVAAVHLKSTRHSVVANKVTEIALEDEEADAYVA